MQNQSLQNIRPRMKNQQAFFNICIFILCFNIISGFDYCKKSLCRNSGKHIACNNNGNFQSRCKSSAKIINLSEFKTNLVDRHNYYRNMIAAGKLNNFEPATRMATMTWDDELASLAELNVKQCRMEHDKCRNTETFKYSGQNLFYLGAYPEPKNILKDVIYEGLSDWFDEYKYSSMRQINRFYQTSNPTGHFTVMVADRNYKVGCAILQQQSGQFTEFYMACNYATTNIISQPMYQSGRKVKDCKTGSNPKYPALCSIYEKYD